MLSVDRNFTLTLRLGLYRTHVDVAGTNRYEKIPATT
jgi:hypothetical protein